MNKDTEYSSKNYKTKTVNNKAQETQTKLTKLKMEEHEKRQQKLGLPPKKHVYNATNLTYLNVLMVGCRVQSVLAPLMAGCRVESVLGHLGKKNHP